MWRVVDTQQAGNNSFSEALKQAVILSHAASSALFRLESYQQFLIGEDSGIFCNSHLLQTSHTPTTGFEKLANLSDAFSIS